MKSVDEHRIRARLARVEALHRGATTPGEREAAARARERLLTHLVEVRANDPIARFCAEDVAEYEMAPPPPAPPEPVPDVRTILSILAWWEAGDWSSDEVWAWAEQMVDQVTLTDDPNAEGAPVAEVLLQLSSLGHIAMLPTDVPRIRRFLRDRDWDAWFALVADAASRRAGRRARNSAG